MEGRYCGGLHFWNLALNFPVNQQQLGSREQKKWRKVWTWKRLLSRRREWDTQKFFFSGMLNVELRLEKSKKNYLWCPRNKGEYGEVAASVDNYERLSSFCYKGLEPSLPHFWSSASLKLELDGTDYQVKWTLTWLRNMQLFSQVYIGSNLTSVARLAQESETAWIYTQVGSMDLYAITMGRHAWTLLFPATLAFQRL